MALNYITCITFYEVRLGILTVQKVWMSWLKVLDQKNWDFERANQNILTLMRWNWFNAEKIWNSKVEIFVTVKTYFITSSQSFQPLRCTISPYFDPVAFSLSLLCLGDSLKSFFQLFFSQTTFVFSFFFCFQSSR